MHFPPECPTPLTPMLPNSLAKKKNFFNFEKRTSINRFLVKKKTQYVPGYKCIMYR